MLCVDGWVVEWVGYLPASAVASVTMECQPRSICGEPGKRGKFQAAQRVALVFAPFQFRRRVKRLEWAFRFAFELVLTTARPTFATTIRR